MLEFRARFERRWKRWIQRRIPAANQTKLNQGNIFIMPTGFGFSLMLMCVLLFVLGTNYQNNLILALCYLLVAIFILSMLHCFQNLNGLSVSFADAQPIEAGQAAQFPIQLKARRSVSAILIGFRNQQNAQFVSGQDEALHLPWQSVERGVFVPARVTVKSYFPLGLFVSWTHLQPNVKAWVFPKAINVQDIHQLYGDADGQHRAKQKTGDDFEGLNRFEPGHSLARVAWKQVAQQKGMWLKNFAQPQGAPKELSLEILPFGSLEQKLGQLCFLAREFTRQQQAFGLRLGTAVLPSSCSNSHLTQTLKAIAAHGKHIESQP